jgi:hypothetical protein
VSTSEHPHWGSKSQGPTAWLTNERGGAYQLPRPGQLGKCCAGSFDAAGLSAVCEGNDAVALLEEILVEMSLYIVLIGHTWHVSTR